MVGFLVPCSQCHFHKNLYPDMSPGMGTEMLALILT